MMHTFNQYIKISLLLLLGTSPLLVSGQNFQSTEIQYLSQYYFNELHYNPAMAGDSLIPSIGISSRLAKAGVTKPTTINAFAHGYIPSAKSGVGVTLLYHTESSQYKERIFKLGLAYSYEIFNGTVGFLRLGFNGGLLHFNSIEIPGVYNPFNPSQPNVVKLNEDFFKYNMDFGITAGIGRLRLSAGLNHSNEPRFVFFEPAISRPFYRQAYLSLYYDVEILPGQLYVRPSIMMQSEVSGNLYFFRRNYGYTDIGILVYDKDFFMAGVHFKRGQYPYNLSAMIGAKLSENYMIALSLDLKNSLGFKDYRRVEMTVTYDIW